LVVKIVMEGEADESGLFAYLGAVSHAKEWLQGATGYGMTADTSLEYVLSLPPESTAVVT